MLNHKIAIKSLGNTVIFFFLLMTSLLGNISLDLSGVHFIKNASGKVVPTAYLGDSFQLKAIISGTDQSGEPIKIKGIEQFEIGGESTSTNIIINNNVSSGEKVIEYTLITKSQGSFSIGPATVTISGKTYTSNTVSLNIAPAEKRIDTKKSVRRDNGSSSNNSEDYEMLCTLSANKKTLYTEEPTTVTLTIKYRGQITSIRGIIPPANSSLKDLNTQRRYKTTGNGKSYDVIEIKYSFTPSKPGEQKISPAQVIYFVQENERQERDLFNSFFGSFSFGQKQKFAVSNDLSILVKQIPSFDKKVDGIGTFTSFTAKVDKNNVVVNEPITLSLELVGDANFDIILPPTLVLPEGCKSYDSKKFEFILQFPRGGNWTIPAQEFTYFDTVKEQLKTLYTKPISIIVSEPVGSVSTFSQQQVLPKQVLQKQEKTKYDDINFIEENAPANKTAPYSIPTSLILILMALTPLVLFYRKIFAIKIFTSRRESLNSYQKKLTSIIEYNEFDKLYSLFLSFFSEVTKIPQHKITEEIIEKKLLEQNKPKEKIDQFLNFLKECAQYSFTSMELPTEKLEILQNNANNWLKFINSCKK